MKYKKAQEILPEELVKILQDFIEGGYLYIPKRDESKKSWGANTGIKQKLEERNRKIYEEFSSGVTAKELASKYFLAENSLRRIIREYKKGL